MKRLTLNLFCVLALASACTSKNGQASNTDAQETKSDTLETGVKDLPEYNFRDFDIKELAQLLFNEKRTGVTNDSSFIDFFQRCGMQYGELPDGHGNKGFFKIYSDGSVMKAVSLRKEYTDGKRTHFILIKFPKRDTNRLQWMIVQLRAFGMRDLRGGEGWFEEFGGGKAFVDMIGHSAYYDFNDDSHIEGLGDGYGGLKGKRIFCLRNFGGMLIGYYN